MEFFPAVFLSWADALHNFSDAGALIIAYDGNKKFRDVPADKEMTFGYGRAEILGALINSVTLFTCGRIPCWLRLESVF